MKSIDHFNQANRYSNKKNIWSVIKPQNLVRLELNQNPVPNQDNKGINKIKSHFIPTPQIVKYVLNGDPFREFFVERFYDDPKNTLMKNQIWVKRRESRKGMELSIKRMSHQKQHQLSFSLSYEEILVSLEEDNPSFLVETVNKQLLDWKLNIQVKFLFSLPCLSTIRYRVPFFERACVSIDFTDFSPTEDTAEPQPRYLMQGWFEFIDASSVKQLPLLLQESLPQLTPMSSKAMYLLQKHDHDLFLTLKSEDPVTLPLDTVPQSTPTQNDWQEFEPVLKKMTHTSDAEERQFKDDPEPSVTILPFGRVMLKVYEAVVSNLENGTFSWQ